MAMEYFPDFFGPRGMGEHRALSLVAGVTIPPKSRSILRFVADEPRSISNQLPARRRANDMRIPTTNYFLRLEQAQERQVRRQKQEQKALVDQFAVIATLYAQGEISREEVGEHTQEVMDSYDEYTNKDDFFYGKPK